MLLGMVPYVRSIVSTKETILNQSSWFIWMVIGFINFFAYRSSGEKETIWLVLVGAVNPSILFFLSLRYGTRVWLKSDTVCILLAIASLVVWRISSNPALTLTASLTADLLAMIPLLIKIRSDPDSENVPGWVIGMIASACNIVAIKEWTWANGIYNLYMFIGIGTILFSIVLGRHRKTSPR